MAWVRRSRPCLAEPPALSPSTRNSSQSSGSFSEQSASLPGSDAESSAPFRRVRSRAFRAASRALAASIAFAMILRPTDGFSSKYPPSFSFMKASTWPLISELRLRQLDTNDCYQPLPYVFRRELFVVFLEQPG